MAALSVVGVHSAYTSGLTVRSWLGHYTSRLEIGVSVFFVISGFLLYRPFALAHLQQRSVGSVLGFWARRLRRIVPAFWLSFLVITYVFGVGTVRHDWYSPIVYLGFAQIYSLHYAPTGITQAWSLCTEMSFYLLLPLWAGLLARAAGDRADPRRVLRVELAAVATLVVAGEAFRAACLASGGKWPSLMLDWLPAYLDLFGLGMLLAVASAWWATTGSSPAVLGRSAVPWASWALAAGAFVVVSNLGLPVSPLYTQQLGSGMAREALYGIFAFLLVAPAVVGPQDRSPIRAFLRWRLVAALGVVSYGIYLWHQAWIFLWLRWTGDRLFTLSLWWFVPFVVAMAVLSATISWWAVERWVIRRKLPGREHIRGQAAKSGVPEPIRPTPSPATLVVRS